VKPFFLGSEISTVGVRTPAVKDDGPAKVSKNWPDAVQMHAVLLECAETRFPKIKSSGRRKRDFEIAESMSLGNCRAETSLEGRGVLSYPWACGPPIDMKMELSCACRLMGAWTAKVCLHSGSSEAVTNSKTPMSAKAWFQQLRLCKPETYQTAKLSRFH